jgi:hypothetical protein
LFFFYKRQVRPRGGRRAPPTPPRSPTPNLYLSP